MSSAAARKSIPLTDEDRRTLALVRTEGTPEHDALLTLAGQGADRSEATALHALLTLGHRAVREQTMATGYAAYAEDQDDEDRAFHAWNRTRRRTAQAD